MKKEILEGAPLDLVWLAQIAHQKKWVEIAEACSTSGLPFTPQEWRTLFDEYTKRDRRNIALRLTTGFDFVIRSSFINIRDKDSDAELAMRSYVPLEKITEYLDSTIKLIETD